MYALRVQVEIKNIYQKAYTAPVSSPHLFLTSVAGYALIGFHPLRVINLSLDTHPGSIDLFIATITGHNTSSIYSLVKASWLLHLPVNPSLRCMTWSLLDSSIEMEFLVSNESSYSPITPITPVKYDMQQMLILKVTSENLAKVQNLL